MILELLCDWHVLFAVTLAAAMVWRSLHMKGVAGIAYGAGAICLATGAVAYHFLWTPILIPALLLLVISGLLSVLATKSADESPKNL